MTKDGRPSRLNDTRLFTGRGGDYLKGQDDAWAFARRLTWWLNGEGFSIGHNPALYVSYTTDLPVGVIEAEPPRFTPDDWWFRTVAVGVPQELVGENAFRVAADGLIACLKALKPQDSALIDRTAKTVADAGSQCRFLLKAKDSARQLVEISTTIGSGSEPSLLYVAETEKATGAYREAPPAKLRSYDDGVYLAGKVKIARRGVDLIPRTSTLSRLVVDQNPDAATWSADALAEAERPVLSSLLRFR
nr:hypothetical protein [Brevundimonas diminuta]